MKNENDKKWISSKEAMKKGKIKACDLMHYRERGQLNFIKKGNAFFYDEESIIKFINPLKSKN